MQISLYHNPRCSKSRAALALLREAGIEPTLVDYLNNPPTLDALARLVGLLGVSPQALLRTGETEYQTLNLARPDLTDAAILAALHQHPRLLERPIAVRGDERAVIGRPPERVLELLDHG
jgi:arsenate reductase